MQELKRPERHDREIITEDFRQSLISKDYQLSVKINIQFCDFCDVQVRLVSRKCHSWVIYAIWLLA